MSTAELFSLMGSPTSIQEPAEPGPAGRCFFLILHGSFLGTFFNLHLSLSVYTCIYTYISYIHRYNMYMSYVHTGVVFLGLSGDFW